MSVFPPVNNCGYSLFSLFPKGIGYKLINEFSSYQKYVLKTLSLCYEIGISKSSERLVCKMF